LWKVLVADNPSAKPLQIESIPRYFPVVYSLQLRQTYGKEIIQAESWKAGFIRGKTSLKSG